MNPELSQKLERAREIAVSEHLKLQRGEKVNIANLLLMNLDLLIFMSEVTGRIDATLNESGEE
jgi:hypothetical protein